MKPATSNGALTLDAEGLYRELRGVQQLRRPDTLRWASSGGAWLTERLQQDPQLAARPASSPPPYRDDYARRGQRRQRARRTSTSTAPILLLDDVRSPGCTIRAVLNELFDYGRPASWRWRCWWTAVAAASHPGRFAAARVTLPADRPRRCRRLSRSARQLIPSLPCSQVKPTTGQNGS